MKTENKIEAINDAPVFNRAQYEYLRQKFPHRFPHAIGTSVETIVRHSGREDVLAHIQTRVR